MASPTTGATPGPISGMPAFTGTLSGLELIPIAVPPFGVVGSNRALPVVTLATAIIGNFPPQSANTVFAGPTSGAGTAAPIFRNLVLADIPGGTSGFPLVGNNATSAPSYQLLTVPGGGTGTSTLTQNGILYGNGASVVGITNAPATGQILAANNGTAVWSAAAAIGTSLQVPLIIGGVNANSTLTLESTSGAGSTDAIIFNTGSQTQAMRIVTGGEVEIGPQTSGYANALLDVNYTPITTLQPPGGGVQQIRITSHSAAGFVSETFNPSVGVFPVQYFRAASGTSGTPLAMGGGRDVGVIFFQSFNGANYGGNAQIAVNTLNPQSATDSSGSIGFAVTPSGTTTLITSMTLQASGGVSVGTTTDPGIGQLLANTAIVSPLHQGGYNATSTLTLESTNAAGTGDAIIFKTGSQTQAMRITSAQEVLIGPQTTGFINGLLDVNYNTTNPIGPPSGVDAIRVTGANGISPAFVADSFGSNPGALVMRSASGTLQAPTPTPINQNLALFQFYGFDGTNYGVAAQILAQAAATFNATTHPGFMAFDTTPGGTTTIAEAMRLQASGGLSIGTSADPGTGGFIIAGSATIGGFLNATSLAAGTTTNPGTGAFIVTGTATVGGLLSVAGAANITGTTTITNYANASSLALGTTTNPGTGGLILTGTATIGGPANASSMAVGTTTNPGVGQILATGKEALLSGVALNATATAAILISSVANFGIYCGTGVPGVSAATGSLYLRNDGSTATTRMYVNQNGSTTWTAVTTQA